MKAALFALAVSVAMVAPVAVKAGESSTDIPRPQMTKAEKKLLPVVKDYIRNGRGWMDGSYTVELYAREDDKLIFAVYFDRGDGVFALTVAQGQSFKVTVDPATKTVVDEAFF